MVWSMVIIGSEYNDYNEYHHGFLQHVYRPRGALYSHIRHWQSSYQRSILCTREPWLDMDIYGHCSRLYAFAVIISTLYPFVTTYQLITKVSRTSRCSLGSSIHSQSWSPVSNWTWPQRTRELRDSQDCELVVGHGRRVGAACRGLLRRYSRMARPRSLPV